MKILEEIKDEYATEKGYSDWYSLYKDHVFRIGKFENCMNEVAKRHAKEVAREALKNASENAKLIDKSMNIRCKTGHGFEVDKQSIFSEDNIPEL